MNTLDTEWWKKVVDEDFCSFSPLTRDAINELIDKVVSSRDTYWKERVEEAVKAERERILKACDVNSFLRDEDHEDFVVYLTDIETITKATPITNEDNLK